MNLTYLCYGSPKVGQRSCPRKAFRRNPCNLVELPDVQFGATAIKEKDYGRGKRK
ncbi:MAG: hypothetical protein AAF765_05780 [Bacteroidota bacterium]